MEIVTPAPKVYPPQTSKDLRKIAGTFNFSKLFEQFLAEVMVEDMKTVRDPSQYGNLKGVSTQHYLIKMVDRIMTVLDSNNQQEANAVVGIQSFLRN